MSPLLVPQADVQVPVKGLVLHTGLSTLAPTALLLGLPSSKALFPFSARSVFPPEMSLMSVLSRSALSNFHMFGDFHLASISSISLLWSEAVLCGLF